MQNTTTQSQNFMTKPGMPSEAPKLDQPTTPSPKKKMGSKPKKLFAVAGLVLFLIVAVMGVLIAQKQVAGPGEEIVPVAPTAPDSQPSASTYEPNNCVTLFNVPDSEGVCDTKEAYTDFTALKGSTKIPAGSKFNVGDEFVFSITVLQSSKGTAKDVVLVDELPDSLRFVSGPTGNVGYTITNDGQKVTATIAEMGPESSVSVEFKVRVAQGNYGTHLNTAFVLNDESSQEPGACTYGFETLQGITECVSKEMYDLEGQLIADGGALTRGKEYEYRVTVKATNRSLGEVKIIDELPEELEYVRPTPESEKYIVNDPSSGILTANFGVLEDEEMTLGFIMRVPEDIEPTKFENLAKVYAFPVNSRQPEPPANADVCSVSHTILPIGTAECVSKKAYDENGREIVSGSEIDPAQTFMYKITVMAEQTTNGPVTVTDNLPTGIRFIEDESNTEGVSENNGIVTIELGQMQTGQEEVIQFMVQVVNQPTVETFNNVATVITGGSTETEHTCELPLDLNIDYSCNSECETNENCAEAGNDYICYNTGDGKFCRLEENPTNISCLPPSTATPTPTPTPTPTGTGTPIPTGTPTPTPVVTPAPGCDDLCTVNADCSNIDHICTTTADGSNRCRLADYPDSDTCTVPAQPTLPPQLPETGPADWLNWLKAGLVTLGIGTALFLLL